MHARVCVKYQVQFLAKDKEGTQKMVIMVYHNCYCYRHDLLSWLQPAHSSHLFFKIHFSHPSSMHNPSLPTTLVSVQHPLVCGITLHPSLVGGVCLFLSRI